MILRYWFVLEDAGVILILASILWGAFRSAKRRSAIPRVPPKTRLGRIGFSLIHVLRVLGVGLGALAAVIFFLMIERNIYSTITETRPAPSQVSIPADLPFKVREVTFEGGDQLKMAGWRVPSQNGATIILLHGYGGNRTAMLWHARQLVQAGYGVLMYDERASGESEGTRRSFGWEDPRDVRGAIRFLEAEANPGAERIGIAGCSIGAQIALHAAAYNPELEAVWADGPAMLRARDLPPSRDPLLALVIFGNYSLDLIYEVRLGEAAPAPLVDVVGNIAPRPIMLVGGGKPVDLFGSEADMMIPRYAKYAGPNAQTWIIPEAFHCDGPHYRPEEYAERMVKFFDTAFGITR